ncbi:AAA family ATPase [Cerasicoccus arenae]|uniref:Cytidylate kinase n=1 Tax=Cerasicoccus arenae TaxID=424488 RepID=A0A8J3GET1_9BACT|nr:cytidylate kinase-like family protein [Cerasicoccus arenae]MBK1857815.1 cytidylate kinase-like family protein [Cerasicoccus arenae]GHC11715.1 cytidylate kinase [Cerasicoccus arenae]
MSETRLFEKCRAYVTSSVDRQVGARHTIALPAITLSRQVGARGTSIAKLLVQHLEQDDPVKLPPWTLFDKNLIRRVLDDHQLPRHLEKFMSESHVNELQSTINEIVGLHPSMWELHEKMSSTVLRLLSQGHVIVVGRGACVVGAGMRNVLNVRLVGSVKQRLLHLQHLFDICEKTAADRMLADDRNRREYFKSHFGRNIEDPELYHLIINTDMLTEEEIVRTIAQAAMRHNQAPAALAV